MKEVDNTLDREIMPCFSTYAKYHFGKRSSLAEWLAIPCPSREKILKHGLYVDFLGLNFGYGGSATGSFLS